MAETIGLRAVIDLRQFNRGTKRYNQGIAGMNKATLGFVSVIGGTALLAVGALTAGLVAFGKSAVQEGAAYTKAMSNVKAISGATEEDFKSLMATAEMLGRTTKFTALEAAEGMSFLAMAGFEVQDIMSAMPGVLNLAASANLDLGKSADIVSNVLQGFGEDTDQTNRFVDVLARTFTRSNTSLIQLGVGMKFVAPVAADFGLSVESVAGAMGALGDAGIQASMAGTGLRTILLRLAAPTGKAKDLIKELGVEIFDAETNAMLPFPQIIGNMNEALAGMTDQQRAATLETLVGKRAISGFSVLLKKGEKGLQEFEDGLRTGATAEEIAAEQLNNLSGDVTLFKSALSGIKIDVFKALEPLLRGAVGAGKQLLETFGPQLVAAFGKISDAMGILIDFGKNLFTIFQRGGTAGLAEALGLTPQTTELIAKISQSFRELGTAIVSFFLPGVQQLAGGGLLDTINAAIIFLNQNFEAFKGAIIGIGAVLAGGLIVGALSAIVTAIGAILSPIGLLIIAAAAIGAAWATNWMGIREITATVIATITEIVMALVQTFQSTVVPPLQSAFNNLTQVLNQLGLDWGDVWNAVLEAIKIVAIGIGIAIGLVITTIGGLVTGIATALEVATRFIDDFGIGFKNIIEGIATALVGWQTLFQGIMGGGLGNDMGGSFPDFTRHFPGLDRFISNFHNNRTGCTQYHAGLYCWLCSRRD